MVLTLPTHPRDLEDRDQRARKNSIVVLDSVTAKGSAGLRPASRGSAKPAPTTRAPVQILVTGDRETERRSPTGIARERETSAAFSLSTPFQRSRRRAPSLPEGRPARFDPRHEGPRKERRSPTGIARERETSADNHFFCRERSAVFTLTSSTLRLTAKRSAGLRPASRGSAKRADTRSALPDLHSALEWRNGAPVSDRHRAGARNQREVNRVGNHVRGRFSDLSAEWASPLLLSVSSSR